MKIIFSFLFFCLYINVNSQSVLIKDDLHKENNGASPYSPIEYYSYGQTIYFDNQIQATGTITAISFYSNDTTLSHSDSLEIHMGKTWVNFFDSLHVVNRSSMKPVFYGVINYSGIPGWVTIPLTNSFYYNGDSNLIVAINELRAGYDSKKFAGFLIKRSGKLYQSQVLANPSPINIALLESLPPYTLYLGATGTGSVADVILHGLTRNTCWTPQRLRFSNLTDHSVKMMWSPPDSGNVPAAFDVYFGKTRYKPLRATIADSSNIADTQLVVNNLNPNTRYYAWVRSRCSGTDKSVWTLIDSFTTLCTAIPIPTAPEQFSNLGNLPPCWTAISGRLYTQTVLTTFDDRTNALWRRVPQSSTTPTNYIANVLLLSDTTYQWLLTPPYNLGTGPNKSLEFDCGTDATNGLEPTDAFAVVISTDNGLTWSSANVLRIWYQGSSTLSTATAGQHVSISLSSYTGPVRIGFYVGRQVSTNSTFNIWVDNVHVTGVMPVTLLAFTGAKEGTTNLLKWRTATEQNNRGFELQRAAQAPSGSPEGGRFSTIGFVPTKAVGGNSTSELSYSYYDKTPPSGGRGTFYRLKQVDLDGTSTFSNIVFLKGEAVTELIVTSLYPNPTNQLLNAVLETPVAQRVQLVITDLAGKIVKQQTLELQKGANNKTVNVAVLAKGTYVVKIVCANGCEAAVRRFVKE